MNIRTANNNDSERVKSVIFSVLREYNLVPDPEKIDLDLDSIEEYYHRHGCYFGVVESEETIVATVAIYRVSDTTCELRKMYALQSHRGKGLGKKLIDFAITKAKEFGYSRIILETATPLKEAIALYKKHGFKEYTPKKMVARCDQAFELFI